MDTPGMTISQLPVTSYQLPDCRGVTLMELVTASTVSLVVILAIGQIDVTRLLLSRQVRETAAAGGEATLALAHFARDAQRADRVNLIAPGQVQLRLPDVACGEPACLDNADSYRWVEYKQIDANLFVYDHGAAGCGAAVQTFHDLKPGSFAVRYLDVAQAPPGGEPFTPAPEDNNVLAIEMVTTLPDIGDVTYTDAVTLRASAYTNVGASDGDSGTGLAPAAVSPPPESCGGM